MAANKITEDEQPSLSPAPTVESEFAPFTQTYYISLMKAPLNMSKEMFMCLHM